MITQFIKKNYRSDYATKIKNKVYAFMLNRPKHTFGCIRDLGCQIPVKIIAANACEKDKPVVICGKRDMQYMTALPGHQYRAKGNIETTEKKKIKYFPDPDQVSSNYCSTTTLPVTTVSL